MVVGCFVYFLVTGRCNGTAKSALTTAEDLQEQALL